MQLELLVGLLLIGVGLPINYLAWRSRSRRMALLRDCVCVTGRVIRFDETPASESSISEASTLSASSAVVEYRDKKNRRHELTLPEQSHHHSRRVGTKLPVYYQQGRPENATIIKGAWDVNAVCAICLAVLLVGVGCLYTAFQEIR